MISIFYIAFPVFSIITLGFVCVRCGYFDAEAPKVISFFALYCAMPCYLFLAMAKVPREMIAYGDYIASFACSMAVVGMLGGIIARMFHKRDGASTILSMMGACHTNSTFVGIPIIIMVFGQAGPVVIVTLFQVIVVTTIILTSIEIYRKHSTLSLRALLEFPQTVLLNPIVSSSLLGTLFALFSWPIPMVAERSLRLLGDAGIPSGLFALGLSLGSMQQSFPAQGRSLVYGLVALKTMIHPAAAWLIGRYVFHLADPWLGASVLVAAMPTAVNSYIFAQRYKVFIAESCQVVFLSSVVSLFTLSALLWVFGIAQ